MSPRSFSRRAAAPVRQPRQRALMLALRLACAGLAPGLAAGAAGAQAAAAETRRNYEIPAGPLAAVLNRFAEEAGLFMAGDAALTAHRQSPGLRGSFTPAQGLATVLTGSGLEAVSTGRDSFALRAHAAPTAADATALPHVTVTANAELQLGELPGTYAGGQIAHGGRAGILGQREALDTPFSIVGFTDQMRQDRQAQSIGDLVEYGVGVTAAQTGDNTQNDILYFRGFRTSTSNGSVDGLSGLLNRQAPVEPFERIEVLLGPSAFVNGRPDNVGGTLNLTPKRAGETPLTRIGTSYVSGGTVGLSADIGRRFGPDNATGLRVNLAQQEGDTPIEPGSRRASTASIGLDHRQRDVRLGFDYIYNKRHQAPGATQGISLANAGIAIPAAPDASKLFSQPWATYDRQFDLAMARAEWDFAPGWTVSAGYGKARDEEPSVSLSDRLVDNAGRTEMPTIGTASNKLALDSGELMVRGSLHTGSVRHNVAVGYNRFTRETRNGFDSRSPSPAIFSNLYAPVYAPAPRLTVAGLLPYPINATATAGWFLSDEILLLDDRLRLLIGMRRTEIDQTVYNGRTGAATSGYKDSATTPALGVVYKATPWLSLYANHVEALEQGSIAGTARANAGELFPPTTSKQVEVGAKAEFGGFGSTLAFYDIDRASLITDTRTNRLQLDGRQVNRGVELSVAGELTRGLRVYGGLGRIDARTERTASGLNDGRKATGVPAYTLSAYLDWDVPGVPGLALSGGLVRNGEQALDSNNARMLRPWTRVDAGLRYRTALAGRDTVFRLNVDNLANKNYWAAADLGTLYLGAPRTVALSMTVDF